VRWLVLVVLLGCSSDGDSPVPDGPPPGPDAAAAIDAAGGDALNLCVGVSCDPGLICEPTTGVCGDPCEGIECPPGQSCLNGICY
jgi:hypothetical protein